MKCTVYVLRSLKDLGLYIGMTSDLERRLKEHGAGYQRSTRSRAPFVVLMTEECETRELARAREKYYKSGTGRELIRARFPINVPPDR